MVAHPPLVMRDPRARAAEELLIELARTGDHNPAQQERVAAVVAGIHSMEAEAIARSAGDAQLDDIAATLAALASLDFQKRASVLGDGGALDGIASVVNMLSEELHGQLEERRLTAERLQTSEAQLRQAQKMDAVGRLAGGVAHDFNNMLSVILSYCEILLTDLPADDPSREDLEEIRTAGNRAAELTHQLLLFSRQELLELTAVDVNDVLVNVDRMLQRVVGEDIRLVSLPNAPHANIEADTGHLNQVILNLVVNARDAMPKGGCLTIETGNVILDEEFARQHLGVRPGRHVMLAVSDNGVGMDAATQARIFEPFFTTKPKGKGTGLGLSTVFAIVKKLKGTIWVYSEPGKGSTFKVYFPVTDAPMAREAAPKALTSTKGNETVLLVEDEQQVRGVALHILRSHGYTVLEARTPNEALFMLHTQPGHIDLLLTDVVMPEMSGPELADLVVAARPDTRVLCMSGYTGDAVVRHGLLEGNTPFLQKPITPDALTRKVREVLDG